MSREDWTDPPAAVVAELSSVLKPEGARIWWNSKVWGRVPRDLWATDPDAVWAILADYCDPSFS